MRTLPTLLLLAASSTLTVAPSRAHADAPPAAPAQTPKTPRAQPPVERIEVALPRERTRLFGALRPAVRAKVLAAGHTALLQLSGPNKIDPTMTAQKLVADSKLGFPTANAAEADVLVMLVLMAAGQEAEEDRREAAAEIEALNALKKAHREHHDLASVSTTRTMTKLDLDRVRDRVQTKLDSLSEMGDTESLRLQMAMDRLSKLMLTLSNLLKKASETASGITQNIK